MKKAINAETQNPAKALNYCTYFNYDKKGHNLNASLKPLENVTVSTISTSRAVVSIVAKLIVGLEALTTDSLLFERVLCIYYPIWFKREQAKTYTLINFGSKVNAITQSYIIKLGLKIWTTNVKAQRIDWIHPWKGLI